MCAMSATVYQVHVLCGELSGVFAVSEKARRMGEAKRNGQEATRRYRLSAMHHLFFFCAPDRRLAFALRIRVRYVGRSSKSVRQWCIKTWTLNCSLFSSVVISSFGVSIYF